MMNFKTIIDFIVKNQNILISIMSFIVGLIVKTIFDWWTRKNQIKMEFTKEARLSMAKDLFESFPEFIKLCKIQCQQWQSFVRPSVYKLNEEDKKVNKKEVEDRSSEIVTLKEKCSMDINAFGNKDGLETILDEISRVVEVELPKHFKNKIRPEKDNYFLNKLNKLRNEFYKKLDEQLKK